MGKKRFAKVFAMGSLATAALIATNRDPQFARAQSIEDGCPQVSSFNIHSGATLQQFANDGNGSVVYDNSSGGTLKLAKQGGNFTSAIFSLPANAGKYPFAACALDADGDLRTDIVGVTNDGSHIGLWRNRTFENAALTPAAGFVTGTLANCTPDATRDCKCGNATGTGPFSWDDIDCILTPKLVPYADGVNNWIESTLPDTVPPSDWSAPTAGRISGPKFMGCADFNNDGRDDFILVGSAGGDDANAAAARADVFLSNAVANSPRFKTAYSALASGNTLSDFSKLYQEGNLFPIDWNRDGWMDFLMPHKSASSANTSNDVSTIGRVTLWTNTKPAGCTGVGDKLSANTTACSPTFTKSTLVTAPATPAATLSSYSTGKAGITTVAAADVTGDGHPEVFVGGQHWVTGSPNGNNRVFAYKNNGSNGVSGNPLRLTALTVPNTLLVRDFTLDGKPDLFMTREGNHGNANLVFYKNDGDTYTGAGDKIQQFDVTTGNPYVTFVESFVDVDTADAIDYDQDPDKTLDILLTNGNDSQFAVFVNRVQTLFVACGDLSSGVLDLGDAIDDEMALTAARLRPNDTVPTGTSVKYYVSNTDPAAWIPAPLCADSPAAPNEEYCATFSTPSRSIRWKAELFSNTTGTCAAAGTEKSPTITSVSIAYDFIPGQEHLRAGGVSAGGITYLGTLQQPGDRGHFYAVDIDESTEIWDAVTDIDSAGTAVGLASDTRVILTTFTDAEDGYALHAMPFHWDYTSETDDTVGDEFREMLATGSQSSSNAVVDWVRQPKFGTAAVKSRLGAIETSTPAIVGHPPKPIWYSFATEGEKNAFSAFQQDPDVKGCPSTNQSCTGTRTPIAIFGSRDGMIHAVNITNGQEEWGFIPRSVASGMKADGEADTAAKAADPAAPTVARAYPDGSPTVADIMKADETFATVAIIGSGNGGKGYLALDITKSANVGWPQPMWEYIPGDATAGQSYSKPVIARVKIDGNTRFIAILATGIANENQNGAGGWTHGREVHAVDVETGEPMWRFKAACPVTSSIASFEIPSTVQDEQRFDGFIDAITFGDYCGNLYRLNPARDLPGTGTANDSTWGPKTVWADSEGWNISDSTFSGTAAWDTGTVDGAGNAVYALFSVKNPSWDLTATGSVAEDAKTDVGVGEERPIAGTIGVRQVADSVFIYFGTGGLENWTTEKRNAMFAVDAKTGLVRDAIAGACTTGTPKLCEKFYNGIVVSDSQIIFTKSTDPVAGTGTCTFGDSSLIAAQAGNLANQDFSIDLGKSTVSSLFSDGGAVYGTTLGGTSFRAGRSAALPEAGGSGGDGGPVNGTGPSTSGPFQILHWGEGHY